MFEKIEILQANVVIACPLEGEKQEYDFLSSIEILICEHLDYIMMQNPDHFRHIAEHLNLTPKEAHDCDFSRVRLWAAEGKSKYFRQNIILSHTPNNWFNDAVFLIGSGLLYKICSPK